MQIHPISPSSQSEDDAATKIQARFRGYRVRKAQQQKNRTAKENEHLNGHSKVGIVRELEEESATKIQAGVRGFLVRKRQKIEKEAAVKIQASFRGFKARKELHTGNNKERSF